MKKRKKMKILLFALTLPITEAIANCSSTLSQSSPDSQFLVNETALVKDSSKSLMWMRCSLGQTWTGAVCEGEAESMTWSNAVTMANQLNYLTFNDWRLPNKNELNSIIETSCTQPSINLNIFPGTISNKYWSSSPYDDESKHIWIVDFKNGSIFPSSATNTATVRLVRDVVN
jgi:hypothetical protein